MSTRNKGNKEVVDIQSTIKTLVNKICSSEEFINEIAESIIAMVSKQFKEKIQVLENENSVLKSRIMKQEEAVVTINKRYEKMEQNYRNKGIRIYGVKEGRNENTTKVVIDLIKQKIKLDVKESKIKSYYGIGKSQKDKPRVIFVYFNRLDVKKKVYSNKKIFKGSGIVIREDLTKEKLNVLKMALEKIGQNGKVWTNNGRVFVKSNNSEAIINVNSKEDIEVLNF